MVMFRETPKPFPPILGLQSERRIKKRLSVAANAIIDQRWHIGCTSPVLTLHSHARKRRSICRNIIACVLHQPLARSLFPPLHKKRKIFFFHLHTPMYRQNTTNPDCKQQWMYSASLGPAGWLAPKLIYMICVRNGQTGRVLALGNLTWPPYRKRASPQVASFWPYDGRARQAATGWRILVSLLDLVGRASAQVTIYAA